MIRNFWTMEDIDVALSAVKGTDVIEALRVNGILATNRWVLVTDCCAELFSDPSLVSKITDHAQFLGQVYRLVKETGHLCPKE